MKRRLLLGLAVVVFLSWTGFAVLSWILLGPSPAWFFYGLRDGPALAAALIAPGDPFAGLSHPQAVPMLSKAFGMGVTPSDGRLLHDIIVEGRYTRALDIGTAEGYAALWFALAMTRTGGKVVTIEIDPATAARAAANFRQAGLAVDLRVNDAMLELPKFAGDFDFVFIDPGVPLNGKLLELVRGRLVPGGAIAAHNAYFFKLAQPGFLEALREDRELRTGVVPTLSGGISISLRTSPLPAPARK